MNTRSSTVILDETGIDRAISRIAHEIIESNQGVSNLVLLGIPTRGTLFAERLAEKIITFEKINNEVSELTGILDITFFRDDEKPTKKVQPVLTVLPPEGIKGKTVILVDDVLFSGRTIRSALDALNEYGRPAFIRLATLIDRGHRELPIRADFVGKNISSMPEEHVHVYFKELDGQDQVVIHR